MFEIDHGAVCARVSLQKAGCNSPRKRVSAQLPFRTILSRCHSESVSAASMLTAFLGQALCFHMLASLADPCHQEFLHMPSQEAVGDLHADSGLQDKGRRFALLALLSSKLPAPWVPASLPLPATQTAPAAPTSPRAPGPTSPHFW